MTNKKKPVGFYTILFLGFIFILTGSCKKEDETEIPVGKTTAVFNNGLTYGVLTDQDGNTYKTIKIGTQTWMAENLRTKVYRNGDSIRCIKGNADWTAQENGAFCTFENTNDLDSIATYGNYYNWFAVADPRNLAPAGWHLPTDAEWMALITLLGGETIAGGKLKEIGNFHWLSPNSAATNSSGFTALPGSFRGSIYGIFYEQNGMSYWWSKTEVNADVSYCVSLDYSDAGAILGYSLKNDGFTVRCIKD